jgi:hypothetical protein
MRIAYCFYGQPRQYKEGYKHISKFLENYNVDFFFHVWHSEKIKYFDYATWAIGNPLVDCKIDLNAITNLISYYKPIDYIVEEPIKFEVPKWIYESNAYKNSSDDLLKSVNVNNLLSQLYSREKVKNLFQKYQSNYDIVISSRFDFLKDININLNEIDYLKFYVSDFHNPRYIFPDNFFICNPTMYCKISSMYSNLQHLVNIDYKMYDESIKLLIEPVLFFNFFYSGYTIDDVIYSHDIPNYDD